MYGVDISAIDGIGRDVILTLMSEVGFNFNNFESARAFQSWMGVTPMNKITGGKIISSRTRRGKNRLAIALKNAAVVIGQSKKDTQLTRFYRKIRNRHGPGKAVIATARKLAGIIYTMVTKQEEYDPQRAGERPKTTTEKLVKRIKSLINNPNATSINREELVRRLLSELGMKSPDEFSNFTSDFEKATS